MTQATNPDWIISLDADEIMEDRFFREIRGLLDNSNGSVWFGIVFHHFWHSLTHYRTDKLWAPSAGTRIFQVQPGIKYEWLDRRLHCGSVPQNVFQQKGVYTNYRVKHYGYADGSDRTKQKYDWYIERDPNGEMCVRSHYDSMLDENPTLAKWIE
jgi:hypothetical protein